MVLNQRTGYARLIYLSCLEKERNRKEIAEAWGMSPQSKTLSRGVAKEQIEEMDEKGYIERKGVKIKSKTDDKLKYFLSNRINNYRGRKYNIDTDVIINLLKEDFIREEVFSIDNIKIFYGFEPQINSESINNLKTNFLEIFQAFTIALILFKYEDTDGIEDLINSNLIFGELNHNKIIEPTLNCLEDNKDKDAVKNLLDQED